MTPSAASMTAARSSIASRFSILAMTAAVPPSEAISAFVSRTSAARRTNDSATVIDVLADAERRGRPCPWP